MSHENPISIHGEGINLARMAVGEQSPDSPIPEGTEPAPVWHRVGAWMLDCIVLMAVLMLLTRNGVLSAWNLGLLTTSDAWVVGLNWALIIGFNYLYHKYLVTAIGRSLGQRWFGLAVVREDGEPLTREAAGARSLRKLRYLIPVVQLWFGMRDLQRIWRRHTHQSDVDLAVASIVVVANSLPPAKRASLR